MECYQSETHLANIFYSSFRLSRTRLENFAQAAGKPVAEIAAAIADGGVIKAEVTVDYCVSSLGLILSGAGCFDGLTFPVYNAGEEE